MKTDKEEITQFKSFCLNRFKQDGNFSFDDIPKHFRQKAKSDFYNNCQNVYNVYLQNNKDIIKTSLFYGIPNKSENDPKIPLDKEWVALSTIVMLLCLDDSLQLKESILN